MPDRCRFAALGGGLVDGLGRIVETIKLVMAVRACTGLAVWRGTPLNASPASALSVAAGLEAQDGFAGRQPCAVNSRRLDFGRPASAVVRVACGRVVHAEEQFAANGRREGDFRAGREGDA